MKITVETEGGIAFMPGRARPTSVDTGDLGPDAGGALEALVAEAQFFDQPAQPGPVGKGRDLQLHTITVVASDGRSHTVRRRDPLPPPLAAIVTAVRHAARPAK